MHCLPLTCTPPTHVRCLPGWHATCNLLPYTVAIGGQLWVSPNVWDERPPPPPLNVPEGTRGLNPYQTSVVPTCADARPSNTLSRPCLDVLLTAHRVLPGRCVRSLRKGEMLAEFRRDASSAAKQEL